MKKSKPLFESVTDVVVFGICAVILLRILAVYIGGSEVCMKQPVCQLQWLHWWVSMTQTCRFKTMIRL
eukprot:m.49864 g.49864  ORF g.49864 m.49864 type:complete len:68 (-) comp7173_c0_seq1:629-832(-)